jgi:pimeloyl-[acyl-carrier protein] methyl ester esterase
MLPTLVLLPGLDGTGRLFAPFFSSLRPEFETVVVRYPTDSRIGYSELSSFVRSQLPYGRPFVLLAESFSGPIAISLAVANPKGLVGLILCATFAQNPQPRLRRVIPLCGLFPFNLIPSSVLSYFLLGRFATKELRELLKQTIRSLDRVVIRNRLRAIVEVDVADQLELIRVPTLCLMATDDRMVPSLAMRLFERRIPQCEVVPVEGPHLLLQSAPVASMTVVRRFLDSLR